MLIETLAIIKNSVFHFPTFKMYTENPYRKVLPRCVIKTININSKKVWYIMNILHECKPFRKHS